LAQNQNNVS